MKIMLTYSAFTLHVRPTVIDKGSFFNIILQKKKKKITSYFAK